MSLRKQAFLELDVQDDTGETRTATFRLREALSDTGNITKQFLLANRGQAFRNAYDIGTDILPDDIADADLDDRKGYHVDAGAGTYAETLSFSAGPGDSPWGDGSAPSGEYNKYDASGEVPLIVKKQVFDWAVAQSQTDSSGGARLHVGEWTDGSHSDSAGVFGRPMSVAVMESSLTRGSDDPSELEGTLELEWTALFPNVDVVGAAEGALDEAGELIPDF